MTAPSAAVRGAAPQRPRFGGLATWLGVRSALWIMIGIAVISGALLLTRTFRGLRDLPTARPDAAPAAAPLP